jgi:hypothetical protein
VFGPSTPFDQAAAGDAQTVVVAMTIRHVIADRGRNLRNTPGTIRGRGDTGEDLALRGPA